ncbi:hypothetical protein ONZ45_g6574 [Pleurotus djamor]|nr:hypothetical protein ONZ45_g6574 [Pleurotus djamor]
MTEALKYLFVFVQSHADFRIPELRSVAQLHGFSLALPETLEHHDSSRPFMTRQREVMESFGYMNFLGKIDLKAPEITLACFEEYTDTRGKGIKVIDGQFLQVYFGRLKIEDGSARSLVTYFDVKKRTYYGNTSMEAAMSLLMANQALARPGSLVYDPFMGTGSMAYVPTSHFGSFVIGSDIDGRQMRGKGGHLSGKPPGVLQAAAQYGTAQQIVDLLTFDTLHVRQVRSGSGEEKKRQKNNLRLILSITQTNDRGSLRYTYTQAFVNRRIISLPDRSDQPYIPPTKPYELSELARDLVSLARYLLKPGGRLVFFLPTVNEHYEDVDIQGLLLEGMELVSNSLQDFGSWGRRLVTIQKTSQQAFSRPSFDDQGPQEGGHVPAHKDFREKYFQGFKNESDTQTNGDLS